MIYCLTGQSGSGKDTIAKIWTQYFKFTRLAFADALKNYTALVYDLPVNIFHDVSQKDCILEQFKVERNSECPFQKHFLKSDQKYWTPRDLLLLEGACKRAVSPNFWIDLLVRKIEQIPANEGIVITDIRFENEYEIIRKKFSHEREVFLFEVTRPNHNNSSHYSHSFKLSENNLNNKSSHSFINDKSEGEIQKQAHYFASTRCPQLLLSSD